MIKLEVNGEVINLDNRVQGFSVKVVMSDCPDNFIKGNLKVRYLPEIIRKEEKISFSHIRIFEIEKLERDNKKASFYNKTIFDMTKSELRDLCCEFCFMNVNTNQSLDKIQQEVAVEWIKRHHGYKKIEDTAFYIINKADNTGYIDYNLMAQNKETLFIVKEEYKPKRIQKGNNAKISLEDMIEKATSKKETKTTSKNSEEKTKDNIEEFLEEMN